MNNESTKKMTSFRIKVDSLPCKYPHYRLYGIHVRSSVHAVPQWLPSHSLLVQPPLHGPHVECRVSLLPTENTDITQYVCSNV